jgi:hypothetical protein
MPNRQSKRRLPPGNSDTPKLKRSREDIEETTIPNTPVFLSPEDVAILKTYQPTLVNKTKSSSKKSGSHCEFCDSKFTSPEALSRHIEIKSSNTGKQIILSKSFKKNSSQIIVCGEMDCCFSTHELPQIYRHDKNFHNSKNFNSDIPYKIREISVMNIIENMPDPTDNTCGRCLKNFATQKTLMNHKSMCSGKQVFSCGLCRCGFITHANMVDHILMKHKADSSFKTTGVFVGRSRKQKNGKLVKNWKTINKKAGYVYEKTHVPLTPGLTHTNQVLTPKLKSEIIFFFFKQVVMNNLLRVHLVLECVISKVDGESTKRIRWVTRSTSDII